VGGAANGTTSGAEIAMGSSGGGGDFALGGSGGGLVTIRARRVDVGGRIDVGGVAGGPAFSSYGGGGGAGGGLLVGGNRIYLEPSAQILSNGGQGGDIAGGGGSGGRIKFHFADFFAYDLSFPPPAVSAAGGAAGTPFPPVIGTNGSPGTVYVGSYGDAGLPNPWQTVTVGPESPVVSVDPTSASRVFVGRPMPNPSRESMSLRLELAQPSRCRIAIVDLQGRNVRGVVDETMSAGARDVSWDLRDADGRAVPVGLYYAQVEIVGERWMRRIVVAR
jgi:hypothetical protein